jgi:hypothetical protein
MENKRKHLEFIQNIITRMANNLFFLKGWTVTLIAGMFALYIKDANSSALAFVIFPLIIFWILDGYFLSQERQFRALYDHVRKLKEKNIDFSMNTKKFHNWNNSWYCTMVSQTLLWFYSPLILIVLVFMYLLQK